MLKPGAARTRVKICGITRVEDGIAAAQSGADAIGLVFWPGTPRRVTFDQARAIVAALPAFVTVAGLFVDPQPDAVGAALAAVPLDLLQFHGDERPELCASFGRPYIKAVPVRPGVDLLQYAARFAAAHGLLFDAFQPGGLPGGTGTTFDWTQLPRTDGSDVATIDSFRRAHAAKRRGGSAAIASLGGRRLERRRSH